MNNTYLYTKSVKETDSEFLSKLGFYFVCGGAMDGQPIMQWFREGVSPEANRAAEQIKGFVQLGITTKNPLN